MSEYDVERGDAITYRVTVRDYDTIFHVDVDIPVGDLNAVHELAHVDVAHACVLVRIGVLPNDERAGRRRLPRELLYEVLRNLNRVAGRVREPTGRVEGVRAVNRMWMHRAEAEGLPTTDLVVVVATGVGKCARKTERRNRSDE